LYDHALTPVHAGSEMPLVLNIAGNMDDVLLGASEAAQVTVGGNLVDSRFQGMNLSANDVTSIDVGGDIINAPSSDGYGYTIGGGGSFDVTAHNMDLGTTVGIQSWGVGLYNLAGDYPLASLFDTGANINVDLSHDLSMTSSSIASFNGGNISVYAGGNVAAGSENAVTALGARGIYTTAGGDVSVIAKGDIDVNGSRIATYDGGDVTVESLDGNINAGAGGRFADDSRERYFGNHFSDRQKRRGGKYSGGSTQRQCGGERGRRHSTAFELRERQQRCAGGRAGGL
jgi:hypothetical protein